MTRMKGKELTMRLFERVHKEQDKIKNNIGVEFLFLLSNDRNGRLSLHSSDECLHLCFSFRGCFVLHKKRTLDVSSYSRWYISDFDVSSVRQIFLLWLV